MPFWKRKKKAAEPAPDAIAPKPQPASGPSESEPRAVRPTPLASTLAPPARLDANAPLLARDGLDETSLALDEVAFRSIALPDLGEPFLDPNRPESFGEPNYAWRHFIECVRAEVSPVVDNFELLVIHVASSEAPHVGFAYTRDRNILPVWLESDDLAAWLELHRRTSDRAFEIRVPASGGYSMGGAHHNIDDGLSTFMIKSAPSRWRGLDDMPAKQKFLDDAAAAATRRAEVDPASVVETWRTLIELTSAPANPPATDEQIVAFEDATGLTLPPELGAILRVHNGAPGAFGMMTFMSLEKMLLQWGGWKQIFDEWPLDELLGSGECPGEEALGIYTTPQWIPLVEERTGNFAALDLAPGPNGAIGQIIYFGAEESLGLKVLATDLGDFLHKQLDYVRVEIEETGEFNSESAGSFYFN